MNAELVRLRARQHLHDREQPVERAAADPFLFVDELAADHRDLRDRAAERHHPEAQEADEQGCIGKA